MNIEHRTTLTASAEVAPGGEFEILAITAGEGNGWTFGEDVLQASLPLWEGVECFVDHNGIAGLPPTPGGRSVRDLGGMLSQVSWNPEKKGIQVRLKTVGPSGSIISHLGRQMVGAQADQPEAPRPKIGFSADVQFIARRRAVVQITRVHSVDLVYKPARGGQFVRALNAIQPNFLRGEEETMSLSPTHSQAQEPASGMPHEVETEQVRQRLAQQQVLQQMCQHQLEASLAASKLPAPMQAHVRASFKERIFEPGELTAAIENARELLTALTGGQSISGPAGCLTGMFSSEDQLQAAVQDLFGVERDARLKELQPARLSGIRELYLMLTGDDDLTGGYHPSRARLATTADFTGLVKNALNKIVANQWELLGRAGYNWWERVTQQERFSSLQQITGTLVGTVGRCPPWRKAPSTPS
jgi:hypothetical protein